MRNLNIKKKRWTSDISVTLGFRKSAVLGLRIVIDVLTLLNSHSRGDQEKVSVTVNMLICE